MPARSPRSRRAAPAGDARERIERTAYQLFSQHGIHAVGVDTLASHAGVAKMTLYRHYPSKDDLALAFLRRREELWTRTWLANVIRDRTRKPAERLLGIFDLFDGWFRKANYEACSFLKTLLEHSDPRHRVRIAALGHVQAIRALIIQLAAEARVRNPERFALQWQMLMMGCIVAAYAGERDAARRAREVGRLLLQSEARRA
ncbi:MAG TPA: TetR/AcrR family transcriptional regulator [Burkholderiales bacterium]|nr:TetR/AcrR family transcriptional regulator [Burkholderiales bacterium]